MSRRSSFTLLLIALLLGCAGPADPQPVNPGQARKAPGPPLAADLEPNPDLRPTTTGEFYRVQPGDTLWAIAAAHNVEVELLAQWNRINRPDQLFVGNRLRIKPPSAKPDKTKEPIPKPNRPSRPDSEDLSIRTTDDKKEAPPPLPLPPAARAQEGRDSLPGEGQPPSKPAKPLAKHPPSQWQWPHDGRVIARFGRFGARQNTGIDIAAQPGDPIRAVADGVVAYADQGVTSYGNMILLRHSGSFMTAYAHIEKFLVKRGQSVNAGQVIATTGQTGITPSPRLHFEIRRSISPVNPLQYLPRRN